MFAIYNTHTKCYLNCVQVNTKKPECAEHFKSREEANRVIDLKLPPWHRKDHEIREVNVEPCQHLHF